MDQVSISSEAFGMGRLLRMWGTLSQLFGQKPSDPWPDLQGLREALVQAQKNLQEARTRSSVMDTLKSSVLQQAEVMVEKYYGLKADGAPLRVQLDADMGGALAAVSYGYDGKGRATNQILHINMSQFTPDTSANGTNDHVIENDRIVAHEITHAVMGRAMDWSSLPEWFKEGTAEYIAGGAERVNIALQSMSPQTLIKQAVQPWTGDSAQYAAAYLAVRFMDKVTTEGGGIKAVMSRLKSGDSLDSAISKVTGGDIADTESFLRRWLQEGTAFLRTIDLSGHDAGSIKSGVQGPDVVPDRGYRMNQPMSGFRMIWPSPLEGTGYFAQAGAVAAAYRQQMLPQR